MPTSAHKTASGSNGTETPPDAGTLTALLEIANYVGSLMEIDDILDRIVGVTARAMKADTCSLYLWNEDRSRLVMRSNVGLEPDLVGAAHFEPGRGIPGWVAEHGEIVALRESKDDPRHEPLPSTLQHDFHAYLCAPLRIQNDVIGTMVLRFEQPRDFTPEEILVCETICKQVAIVIEKSRLYNARVEAEKLAAVALSLSGVAHFIKNLLQTMRGSEYLIDTGLKRGDLHQTGEGWAVLKRTHAKIKELVENMLNYHRETELHPRPGDLNSFLLEMLQNLEDRAMEHGVVLTPDLDLRLERVEFDPDALQDVMINLVSNAIDAIPPGRKGIVRVSTRLLEEERRVRIGVADNGAGVKPEDRAKLFTLFFSTKGKKGTGIGLAATRRIVLDHHGTIDFDSRPGEGTEFVIHLPLGRPRAA